MIDERQEELAALYAFDLLEGTERAAFERELAQNAELRALVDQLRESASSLAHAAPAATPPAELKARVLASVRKSETRSQESKIISFPTLIAWAAAACLALTTALFWQRYSTAQVDAQLARDNASLTDATMKSLQNQLDAERILARRQLADLNQQVTDAAKQLADAQQQATTAADRLIATTRQLAEANQKLSDATQQIATLAARADSATRLASDNAANATDLNQLLASARTQIATLEQRIKSEADLANFKITTLASMLKDSPQALAVAVWNPAKQEGVATFERLPVPTAAQDLELWVIDPTQAKPIAAGVFAVAANGSGRVQFKTESPVTAIKAFAVSREKKGGAPAHAGPQGEVIMISK